MSQAEAIEKGPGQGPPVCSNAPNGGPMVGPDRTERSRAAATNKWDKKVLDVGFLDADANATGQTIRAKVEQFAPEWSQFANIQFNFLPGDLRPGDPRTADITIQTQPSGSFGYTVYQSYYGPQSAQTRPSMWLIFPPGTDDAEFKRVILHEFGHALGLIHEHRRQDAGIVWNEQAVFRYYAYTGWSQAQMREQIIAPYTGQIIAETPFDIDSIMIYPIPAGLANITVAMTYDLSPMDKSFIGRLYPFDVPALPEKVLHLGAAPLPGAIRTPGQVARYRFTIDSPGTYVVETQGSMAVLMGLYSGPDANESDRVAADDGSGQGMNARISVALQPGTYYVEVRHQRNDGTGEFTITLNRG